MIILIPILIAAAALGLTLGLQSCHDTTETIIEQTAAASGIGDVKFIAVQGDGQMLPRSRTANAVVVRALKKSATGYVPVSGLKVKFARSGSGSLSDTDTKTDGSGVARTYFTTGTVIGASTITATLENGQALTFKITAIDYSPKNVAISSQKYLEYVSNADQIAANRTDQIATTSSAIVATDTGSLLAEAILNVPPQSILLASGPTAIPTALEAVADPNDSLTLQVSASIPAPYAAAKCYAGNFSIPTLLTNSCTYPGGMTFPRSKVTTGAASIVVLNDQASVYDKTESASVPFKKSTITTISNMLANADDVIGKVVQFNSQPYFIAQATPNKSKIYRYVGNTVTQVSNVVPGSTDGVTDLAPLGSNLYFNAGASNSLYKYDAFSIKRLSNTSSDGNDQVQNILPHNGAVYFSARFGTVSKLAKYDPATGIIYQISNLNNNADDEPKPLYSDGSTLYFSALDWQGRRKLFKYNGTAISQIATVNANGDDNPRNVIRLGQNVYFVAEPSTGVAKLYAITSDNVVNQVTNLAGLYFSDMLTTVAVYGNNLYFAGSTDGLISKLYRINGTTGVMEKVIDLYSAGSDGISELTSYAGYLYFRATPDGTNFKLYRYDGNKTALMSALNTAAGDDNPQNLSKSGVYMYFSAYYKTGYRKLFRFCDPSMGCF